MLSEHGKMDVYSASDGYLVQIQRQLAEYDSYVKPLLVMDHLGLTHF